MSYDQELADANAQLTTLRAQLTTALAENEERQVERVEIWQREDAWRDAFPGHSPGTARASLREASETITVLRSDLAQAVAAREKAEKRIYDLEAEVADATGEVEELREQNDKRVQDFLAEKVCCNGQDCGCMGITRLQQLIAEEAGAELGALRADREALIKYGCNALMAASVVFTVHRDIISPWNMEDFRTFEKAFLKAGMAATSAAPSGGTGEP